MVFCSDLGPDMIIITYPIEAHELSIPTGVSAEKMAEERMVRIVEYGEIKIIVANHPELFYVQTQYDVLRYDEIALLLAHPFCPNRVCKRPRYCPNMPGYNRLSKKALKKLDMGYGYYDYCIPM